MRCNTWSCSADGPDRGKRRPEATGLSEQGVDRGLMEFWSYTEDDSSCFGMETDTGSLARSTLAHALYCHTKPTDITCPLVDFQILLAKLDKHQVGSSKMF